MTLRFFQEFRVWADLMAHETGLKAIIIYGKGRHFSAGADLDELLENIDEAVMLANYQSFLKIGQLGIPVISAVRGVCLGSAFELALFCHFRICAVDAVLGLPETTFNLMPGLGGIQRVANLAGKAKALEIILRGMTFTARDALEMGLVDVVVPKSAVLAVARNLARALPEKFVKEGKALYLHKFSKILNVCE